MVISSASRNSFALWTYGFKKLSRPVCIKQEFCFSVLIDLYDKSPSYFGFRAGEKLIQEQYFPQSKDAQEVCLLVACLTSQQQASVFQGLICSDNFKCWHTEIEVADQTFYLTQSQYTDIGPTSPSADPITPSAGRVAIGVPIFKSLVWLDPEKFCRKRDSNPDSSTLETDALTTRPSRRFAQDGRKDPSHRWNFLAVDRLPFYKNALYENMTRQDSLPIP